MIGSLLPLFTPAGAAQRCGGNAPAADDAPAGGAGAGGALLPHTRHGRRGRRSGRSGCSGHSDSRPRTQARAAAGAGTAAPAFGGGRAGMGVPSSPHPSLLGGGRRVRPLLGGSASSMRHAVRLPAVRGLRQLMPHRMPQVRLALPHAGEPVGLRGVLTLTQRMAACHGEPALLSVPWSTASSKCLDG